jgi:TPR repeat protein
LQFRTSDCLFYNFTAGRTFESKFHLCYTQNVENKLFMTLLKRKNHKGKKLMSINLGRSYLAGILLMACLSQVAFAGPEEDFALADSAMDEQDLHQAAIFYRKAAEQNYLPAQTALGDLLRASQDNEQAFGWFLMSAYQGDAAGAYGLGQMYANGEGVEKDLTKAAYWVKHAAEKNYLAAAEAVLIGYRTGKGGFGFKIDPEQAKVWEARLPDMRQAAQKEAEENYAKLQAAKLAARKAAFKAEVARRKAAKEAEEKAAAKKVDDADELNVKNPVEKSQPSQTK